MTTAQWFSAAVVIAAGLAAGFTGFGFNLVAVPLLVVTFGAHEAVIVALLLGLLASATLGVGSLLRREVRVRALTFLLLGGLPGLVVGTVSYGALGGSSLRVIIAVISIVGAVILMVGRRGGGRRLRTPEAFAVGALGGFFTATERGDRRL